MLADFSAGKQDWSNGCASRNYARNDRRPKSGARNTAPGFKNEAPRSACPWGLDSRLNVLLGNSTGNPQAIAGGRHDATCEAGAFPARIYPITRKLFKSDALLGKARLHIAAAANTNRRRRSRFRGCHQGIRIIKALQLSAQQRQRLRQRYVGAGFAPFTGTEPPKKLPTRWLGAS